MNEDDKYPNKNENKKIQEIWNIMSILLSDAFITDKINTIFVVMSKKSKVKQKNSKSGIVYSTNPDFRFETGDQEEQLTVSPNQQDLRVLLDKKARAGKKVTLVIGFAGRQEDLKYLGNLLKSKCGVGGTVKDGQILIQGDFRDKILNILIDLGYKVKKAGG